MNISNKNISDFVHVTGRTLDDYKKTEESDTGYLCNYTNINTMLKEFLFLYHNDYLVNKKFHVTGISDTEAIFYLIYLGARAGKSEDISFDLERLFNRIHPNNMVLFGEQFMKKPQAIPFMG